MQCLVGLQSCAALRSRASGRRGGHHRGGLHGNRRGSRGGCRDSSGSRGGGEGRADLGGDELVQLGDRQGHLASGRGGGGGGGELNLGVLAGGGGGGNGRVLGHQCRALEVVAVVGAGVIRLRVHRPIDRVVEVGLRGGEGVEEGQLHDVARQDAAADAERDGDEDGGALVAAHRRGGAVLTGVNAQRCGRSGVGGCAGGEDAGDVLAVGDVACKRMGKTQQKTGEARVAAVG